MTVRPISTGAGEYDSPTTSSSPTTSRNCSRTWSTMAEKEGKTVELLVVPAVDPFDAMVQTATNLQASRLVTGVSARMASEELARRIGLAWEKLPEPRHPFSLEIISPTGLRSTSTWGRIRRGCGRKTWTVCTTSGSS